jgi:hypothetical protein
METNRGGQGVFIASIVGVILLIFLGWFFFKSDENLDKQAHYDDSSILAKIAALENEIDSLPETLKDYVTDQVNELLGKQPVANEGETGPAGMAGTNGSAGADGRDGATGPRGPSGPSGTASCPNGNCVSLQPTSPGTQETGSINISGTLTAGFLNGDGSSITNVDAVTLNGQTASFYQNASNINTGTLSDARLSANVSLLGSSIQNAEVDNDLSISSAGSVDWTALTNYPSACAAGQAVTTINDTLTCSAFAVGGDITLQNAYNNGSTIQTSNARDISFTLADTATDSNFVINAATGSTSQLQVQRNGVTNFSVTGDGVATAATYLTSGVGNTIQANPGGGVNDSAFAIFNGGRARFGYNGSNLTVEIGDNGTNKDIRFVSAGSERLRITQAGAVEVNTGGFLNLLRAGTTQTNDASSALGDKIALWGVSDATRFGFGIQSSAFVAFLPSTSNFQIRQTAASGQASSGVVAISLNGNGTITAGGSTGATTLNLTSTAANTGLTIGGDTNLFRSAANTLRTNDTLSADAGLITGSGTSAQLAFGDIGGGTAGMFFGSALDTVFYRSGAAALRTNGSLTVDGTFSAVNGNLTVTGTSATNLQLSFPSNIRGKNEAVTAAATTLAITGKTYTDASYAVLCTPNWSTTCYATAKGTTGFTLNFGTAAPAGASVDWIVIR